MENRRNYYRVLHVQPDAPIEIIRTSYRTLMQRLRMHPDLGGDEWNAALINEAYAVLSDPAKRSAYDRARDRTIERMREGNAHDVVSREHPRLVGVATSTCPFCGTLHAARDVTRMASCASCGSPLYPAQTLQRQDAYRRIVERTPRQIPVNYCLTWPADRSFDGLTDDLSILGMRFTSRLELAPQERIRIDCSFCSAVAVVRNSQRVSGRASDWQSGVEFLTVRIKSPRGTLISTDC